MDDYTYGGDDGWDYGPGNLMDTNYSGGTGAEDFDANLFNEAPSANWFNETYGGAGNGGFGPNNWDPTFGLEQTDYQTLAPQGWQADQWDPAQGLPLGNYQTMAPQDWLQQSGSSGLPANLGGISNTLASLFNNKGLMTGLGAILEGSQNKKYAQQTPRIVQQMRQQASPFDQASTGASQMGASSMRDAMQQQLARTMQDPYGQPIVKAQVDQLARAQAIKDAAAGRRSNTATSAPALIAEQAKVAQNYINSLYNPAGAGMTAGMGGLEALLQANKAGVNGYVSPLMSAVGYNSGGAKLQELIDALTKAKGNQ